MRAYPREAMAHRLFALAIPIFIAAWVVTPVTVIGTASFFVLATMIAALAWIVTTTYKAAQPAASPARVVHGADAAGSRTTAGRG